MTKIYTNNRSYLKCIEITQITLLNNLLAKYRKMQSNTSIAIRNITAYELKTTGSLKTEVSHACCLYSLINTMMAEFACRIKVACWASLCFRGCRVYGSAAITSSANAADIQCQLRKNCNFAEGARTKGAVIGSPNYRHIISRAQLCPQKQTPYLHPSVLFSPDTGPPRPHDDYIQSHNIPY